MRGITALAFGIAGLLGTLTPISVSADAVSDFYKNKRVKFALAKHTGKVTKTKKGGRRIFIDYKGKEVKAKVSGSRTKVTIDGKKTKRKHIKVGMTCTFTYPGPGQEAKRVDCKG